MDLNYKVASVIFCHFWRSIHAPSKIIDDDGEIEISTNYKESNNSSDFSA